MAAITRGTDARPSMPVGYERVSAVKTVAEAVVKGDLLVLGVNGWSKSTAAAPTAKRGFAAQTYAAGRRDCSILTHGEMAQYGTGMTAGVALYPGAAGGLDDVAVIGWVGLIHAINATDVEFTL